jgi:hypothetical protein
MTGQADFLAHPNEPLGRIILVPPDGITVVHGELVVEVVVSLADGDECGDKVITGSVFIIKRRLAKPVSQRVDAECGLMTGNVQLRISRRGG